MNFDDFQVPSLSRAHVGISSNASVRSTASRLSLRRHDRLSVSNRGRGAHVSNSSYFHNESQRLSPPPDHDLWVQEPSATSTPRNTRTPFLHGLGKGKFQKENSHVASPAYRNSSSSDSTKENTSATPTFAVKRKAKTKNIPVPNADRIIVAASIFKTPDKLPNPVFPVFTSPQKNNSTSSVAYVTTPTKDVRSLTSNKSGRGPGSNTTPLKTPQPSPSKRGRGFTVTPSKNPVPSPSKTVRSRGSSAKSVPLESQGFCPICQVPFTCINKLPGVHSNNCEVPAYSPECSLGKKCRNTTFYHYLDFRHTVLADERAEQKALEGSDHSDLDLNLDANEDLLDDSSENSYSKRRKLNYSNETQTKHPKSIELFSEEDDDEKSAPNSKNQNISTLTVQNEDDEAEDEPNPFLDAEEQTYLPEDADALPDSAPALAGSDVETVAFVDEAEQEGGKLACVVDDELVPCIPGVCDSNQVAVTFTLTNSEGNPLKVRGVGGPDGWQQVDSSDGLSVTKCGCKHNLHIQCAASQTKQPEVQVQMQKKAVAAGPCAKSLWGPLMKKMTSNSSSSSSSSVSSVSSTSSFSDKRCPYFKLIPSTKFAVDAFNCGDVAGVKFYFLSHFHYDHYIGLTKNWKNVIYCSAITARLAQQQLKVEPKLLRVLEVDQTAKVDGVMVTALDANHCPGSLMLLFQLSDGTNHLHTGDFRASPYMESYSAFWNLDVQNLYLDTTYCNKQYDFPTQEEVVHWAAERAAQNAANEKKCLFVCGSYTIGKEKVFLAIAEKLDCKIWAQSQKLRVLRTLEDPRISKRITTNKEEARVHILPMSRISLQTMKEHLDSLRGRFTEIIAFKPSGWQYSGENNTMHSLQQHGNITVCGLPYSEHSSFSELKRFVQFLRPKQVIPTVKSKGCTWQEMRAVCQEWLRCSNASINKAYQGSNATQSSLKHWRKNPTTNNN